MLVLEEHLAKVQLQLSILVYVLDFDVGWYCDVATSSLRMNIIVFSSSNSSTKKSLTTLSCIFLLLSRTTILFLHEILNNMRQVENRPIPHESFNHLIHGVVKMSLSKFYINLFMEKNPNILPCDLCFACNCESFWNHYNTMRKKRCFATSLLTQFFNCRRYLQLTVFIHHEC